jgi:flagellar motor switch protein FliM
MTSSTATITTVQLGVETAAPRALPGLDLIGDRMARGLCDGVLNSVCGGTVSLGGQSIMSFADWRASLSAPMAVARYRDPAVKGGILCAVPAALIVTEVDRCYGGTGTDDPQRTAFGLAEARCFDRVAHSVGDVLVAAWAAVLALAPTLVATSIGADDFGFGMPHDMVVVQTFACDIIGGKPPQVSLIYPLAALNVITALHADADAGAATDMTDSAWQNRMPDVVMNVRLPVRTVIARPIVSLSRLIALAPGDFIPVTLPTRVPVTAAGCLLAHGTIGEANGSAAIKIDSLARGSNFL